MGHRVLVIEDDPLSRELLCDWLETENYEVRTAANLSEGFHAVRNFLPDIVLLDIQLEREDGLSLMGGMREDPTIRRIPVIVITAHAMISDQQRIMEAGCMACLAKPVDFQELRRHLQRCLPSSKLQNKQ